jgi:hypothetical protein
MNGKLVFYVLWAALTVVGWLVADTSDPAFRFGYGVGLGLWVPFLTCIYLIGRKAVRWLVKE